MIKQFVQPSLSRERPAKPPRPVALDLRGAERVHQGGVESGALARRLFQQRSYQTDQAWGFGVLDEGARRVDDDGAHKGWQRVGDKGRAEAG